MRSHFVATDDLIDTTVIIDNNPHWYRSLDHQNQCLMVWCGIVNGYLIGPYFFEVNVDRHSYLQLLRDHLPGLLENIDLATRQRMWFQQDDAPPHNALIVRDFLNNHYNNRWIGQSDPVARLTRLLTLDHR